MKLDAKKIVAVAIALSTFPIAARAQDVKKGEVIFRQCAACHALEEGKTKIGPSLHGMFGRQAGSVSGFTYSDAMKNSGLTWDEGTLSNYLHSPKALVPGTKMTFPGIKDDGKLQDLIAYLKQATQ